MMPSPESSLERRERRKAIARRYFDVVGSGDRGEA